MIKRLFFKLIKKSPASMPMVQYWKFKESVVAKITKAKDGSQIMILEGEKYPLTTYPRGYLLFGKLSKLKHEIKQVFNESWAKLEEGKPREEIIADIKKKLFEEIPRYYEPMKYDMLPPQTMCPAVREIYRAWTKVSPETGVLRDYLCLILQEDDSYRYRVSDMLEYFYPDAWWKKILRFMKRESYQDSIKRDFKIALTIIENCEIIGDMKERIRLLRRILLLVLENKRIMKRFEAFCKELNWRKVFLTKGDRFHFRGKYYKADYRWFDY